MYNLLTCTWQPAKQARAGGRGTDAEPQRATLALLLSCSTERPGSPERLSWCHCQSAPPLPPKASALPSLTGGSARKVIHSKNLLRSGTLVGSFKMDVGTVYSQPGE